jgi:gamma-glutamylcyclotransferase (GGCT)/AIG2-like uncharacterized protein YtfP
VIPLFGYGTFRKTAWREAILGASYRAQPATLSGYRRVAIESGYLSLRETVTELQPVHGVLIELDAVGWRIADRWEDVPKYQRIDVVVNTMHGRTDAQAYVYARAGGATPVDDDCLAFLTDAEVGDAIELFGPKMRRIRRDAKQPSDDG